MSKGRDFRPSWPVFLLLRPHGLHYLAKNWLDQVDKMNETGWWSIQAAAPAVINRSLLGLTTSGLRGINGKIMWWSKKNLMCHWKDQKLFSWSHRALPVDQTTNHIMWRSFLFLIPCSEIEMMTQPIILIITKSPTDICKVNTTLTSYINKVVK